ncbi:hypothetical protein AAKU52_000950 [Pedobacter sp. CG_S7]|uniref:hypothetical protein n=1 Tax=Pedobacter sp. CG_S7 TaxID=3143930 RepID=UPI003394994F
MIKYNPVKPKKLLILVLLGLQILFIQSCKKYQTSDVTDPISLAKQNFTKQSRLLEIDINGKSIIPYDLLKQRHVDWNRAVTYKIKDKDVVFAPVAIPKEITLQVGQGDAIKLNDNIYLRITTKNGDFKTSSIEMITIVFGNGAKSQKEFSGLLIEENWFTADMRYVKIADKDPITPDKVKIRPNVSIMGVFPCASVLIDACISTVDGVTQCTPMWVAGSCDSGGDWDTHPMPPDRPDPNYPGGGGGSGATVMEIINNVTDPCIKTAINAALAPNIHVQGEMSNILTKFGDLNNGIKVTVIQDNTLTYSDGRSKPAATTPMTRDPNNNNFSATIRINSAHFSGTSVESVSAALIHEFVHAYIKYKNPELLAQSHELFTKYVVPMGNYLHSKFNIDKVDAYSLAWSGIPDSAIMMNSTLETTFKTDDGVTFTRDDINQKVAAYNTQYVGAPGTPLCP